MMAKQVWGQKKMVIRRILSRGYLRGTINASVNLFHIHRFFLLSRS